MFETINRLNNIKEMHIKIVAKNTCYVCVFIYMHMQYQKE